MVLKLVKSINRFSSLLELVSPNFVCVTRWLIKHSGELVISIVWNKLNFKHSKSFKILSFWLLALAKQKCHIVNKKFLEFQSTCLKFVGWVLDFFSLVRSILQWWSNNLFNKIISSQIVFYWRIIQEFTITYSGHICLYSYHVHST